jgi:hypothetical protein
MIIKGSNPYPDAVDVLTTDIGFTKKSETKYRVYLPIPIDGEQARAYHGCELSRLIELGVRAKSHNVDFKSCFDQTTGEITKNGHVSMQRLADGYRLGQPRGASQKAKATILDMLCEATGKSPEELLEEAGA